MVEPVAVGDLGSMTVVADPPARSSDSGNPVRTSAHQMG